MNLERLDSKHNSGHEYHQLQENLPQSSRACQNVHGHAISGSDFICSSYQLRSPFAYSLRTAHVKHFSSAPSPLLSSILQKYLPNEPVFPIFLSRLYISNVAELKEEKDESKVHTFSLEDEQLFFECRKTKAQVPFNHCRHRQYSEPIKTPEKYVQVAPISGKDTSGSPWVLVLVLQD